jgi:predicted thioesterase
MVRQTLAATPAGRRVTGEAKVTNVDGRRIEFFAGPHHKKTLERLRCGKNTERMIVRNIMSQRVQ